MSNTNENKQQTEQTEGKKAEKSKDWMQLIQDFIKNPVTTGVTGLAAGYLLGTYKASKDIEAIKEEHKQQMKERDDQFKLLIHQIQTTNKLIASQQLKGLPSAKDHNEEDDRTLFMEEDQKTNIYKYKPKRKHFQLKG